MAICEDALFNQEGKKVKTTIGIDVDGVLAIHYDRTIDLLNERYNVAVDPKDLTTYYFEDYYGERFNLDRDEIRDFLTKLWEDENYLPESAPSLPMIKVCRELAGMSLNPEGPIIITARSESTQNTTKQWLDRYGIAYSKIIHSSEKARHCRENRIKYFIEDAPHHAKEIAQTGCGVFLLDYPYNRNVEATGLNGIWRVQNPVQIPDLIKADSVR